MCKPISIFCITIIFLFTYISSQAQKDTVSSDGLFEAARHAAFKEDNYSKAILYSKKALAISPNYADIRIFLGRLYTWSKQYDTAVVCFEKVIQANPKNEDAYIAYIDMCYWNDDLHKALNLCNEAVSQQINLFDIQLRKAKILNALKKYDEAAIIVDSILHQYKNNTEARTLAARIRDNRSINKLGISYTHTKFDNFPYADPWHLLSVDYSRRTKIGSVIGRINYANRFKDNGVQYELEAYPKISPTFYSYLNIGYSNNVGIFPNYRGGFSLYANLPASFEAELGFRYLKFTGDPTWIYTIYVGKYYSSFLFGFRTYLTPSIQSISQSYALNVRYYYRGSDDFIAATIGTGISPDDRPSAIQLDSKYKLLSRKASAEWRYSLNRFHIITIDFAWINQEYSPAKKGNQYEFGIGYLYRF